MVVWLAMLFAGFYLPVSTIPAYLRWGRWPSYMFYAYSALANIQFKVCVCVGGWVCVWVGLCMCVCVCLCVSVSVCV